MVAPDNDIFINLIAVVVLGILAVLLILIVPGCGTRGDTASSSELDAEVQALYCLGLCAHTNVESESIMEMRQEVKSLRKQVKKDKSKDAVQQLEKKIK